MQEKIKQILALQNQVEALIEEIRLENSKFILPDDGSMSSYYQKDNIYIHVDYDYEGDVSIYVYKDGTHYATLSYYGNQAQITIWEILNNCYEYHENDLVPVKGDYPPELEYQQ